MRFKFNKEIEYFIKNFFISERSLFEISYLVLIKSSICDRSFGESFGCSALYEYCITESGGAKRMGQIMATWDGSGVVFTDNSTPDLNSSTADFIWKVQKNGTSVELVANVLSGTWDVLVSIRIIF